MTTGTSTSYYLHDSLGSVAHLTSQSGQTQWTCSYEPFGLTRTEQKAPGNQPANFLKFTGEYLDPSGLYHLRARQYDPQLGRFLTRDPAGQTVSEGVLSAYAYVANAPTVMVDPSGETFIASRRGQGVARFSTSSPSFIPPIKSYWCTATTFQLWFIAGKLRTAVALDCIQGSAQGEILMNFQYRDWPTAQWRSIGYAHALISSGQIKYLSVRCRSGTLDYRAQGNITTWASFFFGQLIVPGTIRSAPLNAGVLRDVQCD